MPQSHLQVRPTTPPAAIIALRLLAVVAVQGVHDTTRHRARTLFTRYARPTIRLAITEQYGPRAAHGAFEQVVDRALNRLLAAGGLEVGSASNAALWQLIQATVWPEVVIEPTATGVRPQSRFGTGVLHSLEADEVTALLRLVRPMLSTADFTSLWIAACAPALPHAAVREQAHWRFEHAVLQWAVEQPALHGYADRTARMVA